MRSAGVGMRSKPLSLRSGCRHRTARVGHIHAHNTLPFWQATCAASTQAQTEVVDLVLSSMHLTPGVSQRAVLCSGTFTLLQAVQEAGIADVLAVSLDDSALDDVCERFGQKSRLGNDTGVRVWKGEFADLPSYLGRADMAILGSGALTDPKVQRSMLVKAACEVLLPGGWLVSAPGDAGLGKDTLASVRDLPLEVTQQFNSAQGLWTVLRVPPMLVLKHSFASAAIAAQAGERATKLPSPLRIALEGPVVRGFGRGSRQMGTPTANIDPTGLSSVLEHMPKGVYFGYARLSAPASWPAIDSQVHLVVLNIGTRPTVSGGSSDVTVECFILHTFQGGPEFYGSHLQVVITGFIRPELRFASLGALVSRIKLDTAIARNMLTQSPHTDVLRSFDASF